MGTASAPRGPIPAKDDARRLRLQVERTLRSIEALRAGERLDADVQVVSDRLHLLFARAPDLVIRPLELGGMPAAVYFLKGLVDDARLEHLLVSLLEEGRASQGFEGARRVRTKLLAADRAQPVRTYREVAQAVLNGMAVLVVASWREGLGLGLDQAEKRAVEEPRAESVVRGPREGFIEELATNLSLVRRRLRDPDLRVREFRLGRRTQTHVVVLYLESLANIDVVDEVLSRLERIDVDSVLESAYVEELIEDNPYSLFPQILHTERPDVVAAHLLEGRLAILTDGTPFALILPATLFSFLEVSEDYYERFWIAIAIRFLRFLLAMLALVLPGLYVAVTTFHQEMIPTRLLLRLAAAREGIPWPPMLEALIMEVTFEILREAGVRLPKQIGQALSIVGALVIGTAAIQADIVSPPMVIVVALTGIASFGLPYFSLAIAFRILRFELIVLGGVLGLYGVMLGLLGTLVHLSSLRSFGVPYLSPVAPLAIPDLWDTLFRLPHWRQRLRPVAIEPADVRRRAAGLRPGPPAPVNVTATRRHEE
ncbi:MAG: spore germination protein [Bacillota bacterium]|nr:spore germination protein [Bacillota bacterium]